MTRAKICGLTRARDAAHAVAAGADYLGVVFAPGKRRVTAAEAWEVVAAAGDVPVVAVVAEQSVDEVLRLHDAVGFEMVQLHGSFAPADAARLAGYGIGVWRVVHVADADALASLPPWEGVSATLVEPRVPGALGGTGVALDLALAHAAREALAGQTMVLAGGLTPATVGEAIRRVAPDVVDVSSGVERIPREKDPDLVRAFLEAVRGHAARA